MSWIPFIGGIARLDARPVATLGLEAQEMHERREKVYRDE